MPKSEMTEPMLLFSVAGVSRMMNVPKAAIRDAIRQRLLRTEIILIGDRMGMSIPLSAIAEYWNLPKVRIQLIQEEARKGAYKAPVSIVTPLISK